MPRKPTSAVGTSRIIPSSMPRPARRIGTTSGFGADSRTPVVGATGVSIVGGLDPDVAGRLVRQQRDELVGQPAEGRGVGASGPAAR